MLTGGWEGRLCSFCLQLRLPDSGLLTKKRDKNTSDITKTQESNSRWLGERYKPLARQSDNGRKTPVETFPSSLEKGSLGLEQSCAGCMKQWGGPLSKPPHSEWLPASTLHCNTPTQWSIGEEKGKGRGRIPKGKQHWAPALLIIIQNNETQTSSKHLQKPDAPPCPPTSPGHWARSLYLFIIDPLPFYLHKIPTKFCPKWEKNFPPPLKLFNQLGNQSINVSSEVRQGLLHFLYQFIKKLHNT